jgi:hypothetical protein
MSMPITACLIAKAVNDQAAYAELLSRWRFNKRCGAMSVWPCRCNPPCPVPTEEQLIALEERLEIDMAGKTRGGQ